jgi:ATP-binding cassette, subfamily B, bacterial PglK
VTMIRKLLKLFTIKERRKLYLLFGIMVVSSIIEVAGIASIMPFLSVLTNPSTIQDNKILSWLYSSFGFQSTNRFLIFTGVVVLVILIISNLFIFLTNWGLQRFSWMRSYTVSRRLLLNYLYQPYKFFLNQSSVNLGKNILSEIHVVVKGVVVPLLEIFSRGIVALFIFALLIAVEPVLAFSLVVILGGAYALTYRLIKQGLINRGKKRFKLNAEQFKAVNETFGDIKMLKLMGYEKYFLKRYSKPALEYSKINVMTQLIGSIPRYIIEIIAFGGVIVVILYLLATGKGLEEFLPLIGVYIFSIYRLLPSIQAIFSNSAAIRFNSQGLDILYDDFSTYNKLEDIPEKKNVKPMPFIREIEFKNIYFSYPGINKHFIKDLNIKIRANTSVAFVGATGAGKTTFANIVLGLLRPDSGKINVDGIELTDDNISSWQKNLGYIPQDIYMQDNTVKRNITFGVPEHMINMGAVTNAAKIANIHDFIENELPDKYDTIVGERGIRLSGGQRQRIGIARAIYHNPSVLVLDEATSSLDSATEKDVFKAIENIAKTKTLIMIAHRLTTIQNCDVIYVMENGKIVGSGKYDQLLESNDVFKKIAGKLTRKR